MRDVGGCGAGAALQLGAVTSTPSKAPHADPPSHRSVSIADPIADPITDPIVDPIIDLIADPIATPQSSIQIP